MSTCSIYAILNLTEPPRLLISKYGKKQFHCYFGLPLPAQIIIFRLGKYTSIGYNSRMSINVCLDSETPPFQMGYLEKAAHSVCLQPKWSEDILKRSYILHEKDHLAKLLLTIDDDDMNSSHIVLSNVTSEKIQQLEKRKLVVKLSDVEPFPITVGQSTQNCNSECTKSKRKKRGSISTDCNNNHLVQTTLSSCFSKITKKCDVETPPSPRHVTQEEYFCATNNRTNNGISPCGRWGHTANVIDESKVVIIGGQGENHQMVKDSLYIFDSESSMWTAKTGSQGSGADRRMGHTSTFDPVKKVIYVYGGCKNKRWFNDIHILNIESWKWTDIKAVGTAPKRAYHTSVLFQGELLVFGGVYPNPDPKPDGCSNELYMFNTETSSWYQPIVTGSQPLPCSGNSDEIKKILPGNENEHSFKLYSKDKAVIFGGWDTPKCYNDVFLLDLALMEYTKPSVIGIAPSPRSWHSSALLPGNQLLIHGGFDGANNKVLGDSFMFEIEKLTWLKVNSCPEIQPRVGHVMFCDSMNTDNKEDVQVIVFGGGDNMGNFFSDLLDVHTFTKKKPQL